MKIKRIGYIIKEVGWGGGWGGGEIDFYGDQLSLHNLKMVK